MEGIAIFPIPVMSHPELQDIPQSSPPASPHLENLTITCSIICLTAGCSDPSPLVPLTSQFIHQWTRHAKRHVLVLYIVVLRCIEIMLIYWHHFLIVNSWWVKKDIFLLTLRVWHRNCGQYFSWAVLGGTRSWHMCNQWGSCVSLRLPTLSKRIILRSCWNKTLDKH